MAKGISKRERQAASPARRVFSQEALRRACTTHEDDFGDHYGFKKYDIPNAKAGADYFYFTDRGSNILAVAHLDTVSPDDQRQCHFLNTAAGMVCYSRSLDDRLGAYVILDMLPKLGINVDILLTIGEESGASTAEHFAVDKQYNWIIEFDRGGTDVVMYNYDSPACRDLLRASGARPGNGSFSDIAELEHLGAKAFNWGTGYQDYHSAKSHVWLADLFDMVDQFTVFHTANAETWLEHTEVPKYSQHRGTSWGWRTTDNRSGGKDYEWAPSDHGYTEWWDKNGEASYAEGVYADPEYTGVDFEDKPTKDPEPFKSIHEMTDEELYALFGELD